jgi:hypothetical protein
MPVQEKFPAASSPASGFHCKPIMDDVTLTNSSHLDHAFAAVLACESREMQRTRNNASPYLGSGIAALDSLKCSGPSFSGRLLDQQDLPVDACAHDDPPLAPHWR